MREIKFRVWDKILRQWLVYRAHSVYSVHLYYTQDGTNNSELQFCIDSDNFEVVQYTGLKDKNGKEIFEGDLWKRDSFIARVEMKFAGWVFTRTEENKCYAYPSFYSNAALGEVIGSVYDTRI